MINEHFSKKIQSMLSSSGFDFISEEARYVYNTKIDILANPHEPCYEKATIYCALKDNGVLFSYKCNMTRKFCFAFSECALTDLLNCLNFDFDIESIDLKVLTDGTLHTKMSYNAEITDLEEMMSIFLKIIVLLNYTLPAAYRYLEKKQI